MTEAYDMLEEIEKDVNKSIKTIRKLLDNEDGIFGPNLNESYLEDIYSKLRELKRLLD